MESFKIIMTCYDAAPAVLPYLDVVAQDFNSKEAAQAAVAKCAADELETLRGGEAEGEFLVSFEREGHEAVIEFWEGVREDGFEEMSRDMRPVTVYDIMPITGEGVVFRHNHSQRIIQEHMQDTYKTCLSYCMNADWKWTDQHGDIWDLELRDNLGQVNPICPASANAADIRNAPVTRRCDASPTQDIPIQQEITCALCGHKIVWEHPDVPGLYLASSDYIGCTTCRSCMEEHCAQTNCLGCGIGTWPNCPYQWLKCSDEVADHA